MLARSGLQQVARRAEEVRTPGAQFADVQRMIVVRHDRLGDLVLTLPAVDALRHAYPVASLGLMVRPDLAPLARQVPGVDQVLVAHADRRRLREEIAAFGADLIVCISRGAGISRVAARAHVRHRVGTGYRMFSPLFTRTVSERRRAGGRHELEYALSFAHRCGAPGGAATFPLAVPRATEESIAAWLAARGVRRPFVVLHPGSGGSCPRWPVRHFIELAAALVAQGRTVVFTIGPEDGWCTEVLNSSRSLVRDLPRYDGGLERLPALLRAAGLVVSNSTGPLHLAAALGTPTLGIYAPWDSCGVTRWGPYAANGWAITAHDAAARNWSRRERQRSGGQLLAAVPPAAVARAVVALVDDRGPDL